MSSLRTRLSIPTPDEAYNDLLGERGQQIVMLKLSDIDFYYEQRTRMNPEEELQSMAAGIKKNGGVMEPILVRTMPPDDTHPYKWYQVLNGRNRVAATRLAEMESIKAIIEDCDDTQAAYIVATTTIDQRHNLPPSEKAFAYKMQLEATKRQGERTDLTSRQIVGRFDTGEMTSRQVVGRSNSTELAGRPNGDGERQVQRYIRLTELTPALLQMVDDGGLAFCAGVNLSYLSADEQETIEVYLKEHKLKLSVEQAENIKKYSQELSAITFTVLDRMFYPQKAEKPIERKIKFSKPVLNKVLSYIPAELDGNGISDYILCAVKFYKERNESGSEFYVQRH